MHLWIALGLLQAAAPAAAPTTLDLKCTTTDVRPAVTFDIHVDLAQEKSSVTRNGGAAQAGTAGSYGSRVVLEMPSSNPEAIPMFFINTDTGKFTEARRSGASAITPVSSGTCQKSAAGAS